MTEIEKLVMAHRYLYYVENTQILSDQGYDVLEKTALKEVGEDSPLRKPGSSLKETYPDSVIILAEELQEENEEMKKILGALD